MDHVVCDWYGYQKPGVCGGVHCGWEAQWGKLASTGARGTESAIGGPQGAVIASPASAFYGPYC